MAGRFFTVLFYLLLLQATSFAQSVTNAGTDFWMAFPEVRDTTDAVFQINVSSAQSTVGLVSIPGTGFIQNFSTTPGSITTIILPSNDASNNGSEMILDKAINIKSANKISVYASVYHNSRSEATLVLPTTALGNKYCAITYKSTIRRNKLHQSEFMIVTAGEPVTVEITPTAKTAGGQPAGVPFMVALNPGQIFQVQTADETGDFTGSQIRSLDANDRFALYSGNVWSSIFCGTTADPILEVAYPVNTWGRNYIVLPTPGVDVDLFRVIAAKDATQISVNGVIRATISKGIYYEDTISSLAVITANKPISVGMFLISSEACGNNDFGDPSMIILNPNEQMFLKDITFFTAHEANIQENYVHVVTRTGDTSAIFFNGSQLSGFSTLGHNAEYSYISFEADTGSHTLFTTGCGFLAYALGLGLHESYAYAAGVSLRNLAGTIDRANISRSSELICEGDTIQFVGRYSGTPTSLFWDFGDGGSSFLSNPRHKFNSQGTYIIAAVAEYDCKRDTLFDTLTVLPYPTITLGPDTLICQQDSLVLDAGKGGNSYQWAPGTNASPAYSVNSDGWYYVTVTNQVCTSIDSIEVRFDPTSTEMRLSEIRDDNDTLCSGDWVQFEATTEGWPLEWLWDFGDGSKGEGTFATHVYQQNGPVNIRLSVPFLCGTDTLIDTFDSMLTVIATPNFDLGNDTVLCAVDAYTLVAGSEAYHYRWSPNGETSASLDVFEDGSYSVLADNYGCSFSDEIALKFHPEFIVPNVFTPNNDGVNDFLTINGLSECHNYNQLEVFNRWGYRIYQSSDPFSVFWNGQTNRGEPAANGTYFYLLSGPGGSKRGSISLLR